MQRRYLILGVGILATLAGVFSFQLISPQPVSAPPGSNPPQAFDSTAAGPSVTGASISLPAFAEWRAHHLTVQPTSHPQQVRLQEDASRSW